MPAFNTSISSILQLVSFISPVLLGFFMFMISIFNQNVKGFIYIAGVLGALSINNILNNTIGGKDIVDGQSPICNYLSGCMFRSKSDRDSFKFYRLLCAVEKLFYPATGFTQLFTSNKKDWKVRCFYSAG